MDSSRARCRAGSLDPSFFRASLFACFLVSERAPFSAPDLRCGSCEELRLAETVSVAELAMRSTCRTSVETASGVGCRTGGPGCVAVGSSRALRAARSRWAPVDGGCETKRSVTGRGAPFSTLMPSSYGMSSMPEHMLSPWSPSPSSRNTSVNSSAGASSPRPVSSGCSSACVPGLMRLSCRPWASLMGANLSPSEPGLEKVTRSGAAARGGGRRKDIVVGRVALVTRARACSKANPATASPFTSCSLRPASS